MIIFSFYSLHFFLINKTFIKHKTQRREREGGRKQEGWASLVMSEVVWSHHHNSQLIYHLLSSPPRRLTELPWLFCNLVWLEREVSIVFGFGFCVLMNHSDEGEGGYVRILLGGFVVWILLDGFVVLYSNESRRWESGWVCWVLMVLLFFG